MEVMSQTRSCLATSALNPNAPLFVPMAYRTVEDYSSEWWALVQSSPWFRDYWLQERFQDPQLTESLLPELDDPVLPDIDALFENYSAKQEDRIVERNCCEDLVAIGGLKWRKGRGAAEAPRYVEKAPKIVSARVSPRTIQQPR